MKKKLQGILVIVAICTATSVAQQNPAPFTVQKAKQSAVDMSAATATSSTSPSATVSPLYHDALGRVVVQGDKQTTLGLRYEGANIHFSEIVDEFGNRTLVTGDTTGLPLELKHEFVGRPVWNERRAYDAKGGLLFTDVDSGTSTLAAKAAQFGIKAGFPDWLTIKFHTAITINQVDVITRQDNCWVTGGIKPLRASDPGGPTRFATSGPGAGLGITDYEVQYLDSNSKWVMIPGTYVTNSTEVAKTFVFAPLATTSIRLVIKGGGGGSSRVVEIEAFEKDTHRNVALASQGGSATASSTETGGGAVVGAVIDGDETGKYWGAGGGWKDFTPDVPPPAGTATVTSEYGGYTRTNFSNQFASVSRLANNNPPPTTPPKLGMQFVMERADVTYSGGKSFSATAAVTKWGIEYWDNAGGSRIQYYDANKRLFYVTDWTEGWGHQPVVRINRDAQGRPTDVYLGNDLGLLQFVYDDSGWVYTRLIDLTTNTPYFVFIRRGVAPAPMSYPKLLRLTHGYMPEYGPIIEWHDAISPIPNIVASLKGMPYALLPTTQSGFVTPARWVITPFAAEKEPMTNIRVEYDAENIYLQVPTLNSGSMVLGRDMQAFRFARNAGSQAVGGSAKPRPDTESATPSKLNYGDVFAFIQRSGPNAQAGSGAGGSGGGAGDGNFEPENDLQPCGDCSDTVTVTGKYPGVWFPFDPYPTRPPPTPQPPPETPPGPEPVPEVNECVNDGASSTASASEAPSGAATPCPTPPKNAPCIKLDPNSSTQKQVDWAKGLAWTAMQDKRCANFLKSPGGARVPDSPQQTYFEKWGYTVKPSKATLKITDRMQAKEVWDKTKYYDGSSNPQCLPPPCGGAGLFVNSGHVFVCPGFSDLANSGVNGGVAMQQLLIHEYLHNLGMPENLGTPETSLFPTTQQINDAVLDACGPGMRGAQGGTTPPP